MALAVAAAQSTGPLKEYVASRALTRSSTVTFWQFVPSGSRNCRSLQFGSVVVFVLAARSTILIFSNRIVDGSTIAGMVATWLKGFNWSI